MQQGEGEKFPSENKRIKIVMIKVEKLDAYNYIFLNQLKRKQ